MKKLIILLCFLLITPSVNVFGWGQKGHDVVAAVAEAHLTKKARKNIAKLLDGRTLVYDSSWPDNLRNKPGYEHTMTWHYANVDEGETYESMVKEAKGDVVEALDRLIYELKYDKTLSDSARSDNLRFIVHFIGDMHCPMHAGRLTDVGGNKYPVKWFGQQTNLHKVWDSQLIESAHKWSYTEWQENIDLLNKRQIAEIAQGAPLDWFHETVGLARQIYDSTPVDSNLSYDYSFYNAIIVETQLRNAGYRLAGVLNDVFGK